MLCWICLALQMSQPCGHSWVRYNFMQSSCLLLSRRLLILCIHSPEKASNGSESTEEKAFKEIKRLLCTDTVLAHYDPSLQIGIFCDASEVGIGAILFHRFEDGSEGPIINISKTLSDTQRRYSQVQKEALAVIFALKKFHQFLYGRSFILVTDHKPLLNLFAPNKATPAMAANRLARWSLYLSQYDYVVEYRQTKAHGNADALSRLPATADTKFDEEERDDDVDNVCTIHTISRRINPGNPMLLVKSSSKDAILLQVMRFVREGWPQQTSGELDSFGKIKGLLSTESGCLFYGSRIVISEDLREHVFELLHLGHFGMQRLKQLARSAVCWRRIDDAIEKLCRQCTACAEFQNKPAKPAIHPWMMPEKSWSRVHIDHAINFMGRNWLVVVDAFSKYPCIHETSTTSSKSTAALLEEDFSHFGYPHTIVTDNATTFMSQEFQAWCKARGIIHLSGAPYHPATNGTAERLVQSFKQALRKSSAPPKEALQEFLIQYRRTPLSSGYSPSELLNGRQIRTKLDSLIPSPAHIFQGQQSKEATKSQLKERNHTVSNIAYQYTVGSPCYALYCGPRRDKDPRWVPAIVTKVLGTRTMNIHVVPRGPTWRRHIEQLRPRFDADEDSEPGDSPPAPMNTDRVEIPQPSPICDPDPNPGTGQASNKNPRLPRGTNFGMNNPRRSSRPRKRPLKYCC